MKMKWLRWVFGGAALALGALAIICLASGAVYAANMVGFIDDLLGNTEDWIEIFYVAAPVLLLVVWVGLFFVHRRQNLVMSLVALMIGVVSTILCLVDLHDIQHGLYVENIYAIGIRLPFFALLIFGILGQKAEGMSTEYGILTILLALGFAFANLANEYGWRHFTFLETCLFLLLAAWGIWLGILVLKGKVLMDGNTKPQVNTDELG